LRAPLLLPVAADEDRIENLETSLEVKDAEINEFRTRSQQSMNEREKQIESLNTQVKNYEKVLEEREKAVDKLYNIIGQRDKNILDLTQKIDEKDRSIDRVNSEIAVLDQKKRDSVYQAESAEAKVGELEIMLKGKEKEVASLTARMGIMQDDFTCIVGIGPKVSSVLKSAGINTFEKLGSTEVSRIREILDNENPNLLRLVNPETWPEQARMVSEGD
jgi:predicted flap endonuclease-1-like 5' DNA nuclease